MIGDKNYQVKVYGGINMISSNILKRISKIEEELLKLKIELLPEGIPRDEGFREITKEELENNHKEIKNKDFWGTEDELSELLNN